MQPVYWINASTLCSHYQSNVHDTACVSNSCYEKRIIHKSLPV